MSDTSILADIPANVPPELVRDWDFAAAPGGDRDPFLAVSVLHEGPDIFWAPRVCYGNPSWVVTRDALMREVFQDHATFTARKISGFSALMDETFDMIPLEKDPPDHTQYRLLMNPLFSPMRLKAIEESVIGTAEALVEAARIKGECEFMDAFARPFPATVFLSLMGLPLELTPQFLAWEDGILHGRTIEERSSAARSIRDYLRATIEDRRLNPTDDLVSFAIKSQIGGRPVTDDETMGICVLLFIGGLDTVTATLGFAFRHLAMNPQDQQTLRDRPELIKNAIEEFLRAHAPVNTHRYATRDVDFHGVTLRKGDCVMLSPGLGGRDEREFPEPHKIDFERENLRHIAFGAGAHRCIGSHLARREVGIALELWLSRIPPFRVKAGQDVITQPAQPMGVEYLPIVW